MKCSLSCTCCWRMQLIFWANIYTQRHISCRVKIRSEMYSWFNKGLFGAECVALISPALCMCQKSQRSLWSLYGVYLTLQCHCSSMPSVGNVQMKDDELPAQPYWTRVSRLSTHLLSNISDWKDQWLLKGLAKVEASKWNQICILRHSSPIWDEQGEQIRRECGEEHPGLTPRSRTFSHKHLKSKARLLCVCMQIFSFKPQKSQMKDIYHQTRIKQHYTKYLQL